MIDEEILRTLQKATTAAVAASVLPGLPIKFVGRSLIIPTDQKWLEVVWVANDPDDRYWGNEQDKRGLYRLILHWPIDDRGAYPPLLVAQSIGDYFTKGRFLGKVKISDNPKVSSAIEQPPETLYVIATRYTAFDPS